jgi:NAD dependent epimerase/dehydratase
MKILVTGADGFIGSHLVEKLVKLGHKVTCLIKYNSFSHNGWLDYIDNKIVKDIEIIPGDITDPDFILTITRKQDYVFNLAALIAIPFSYKSPKSYVDTNITGTLNVLNSCKRNNFILIQTSSSEVYGSAVYTPIDENHPMKGQSPYSATKIAADHLSLSFYHSYDLPISIIRPFNTYGPRQSNRAVIPSIILQMSKEKKFIRLGLTSPTRDLSYIDDTVDSFIKTLGNKKIFGEVINIGQNYDISILNLYKLIGNLMNKKIPLKREEKRFRPKKSEVMQLKCDNTKAASVLGWKPKYNKKNGLEKGLIKTINWFLEPKNLKIYNNKDFNL